MRLRFSTDETGTLWIVNPVGASQKAFARTAVRVLVLGPLMWLLMGGLVSAAAGSSVLFNPVFLIAIGAFVGLYVSKPRRLDTTIPYRLGFSREWMKVEFLGGDLKTFPWAIVSGANVGTGKLLGARLALSTTSGAVEIPSLNWDVALRALWACRAGPAGTLDPAALGEGEPTAEPSPAPSPTAVTVKGSDSKLYLLGETLFFERAPGNFIRLPRDEVDLVNFTMGGTIVLHVAWRGRSLLVIGPDEGIAQLRAWQGVRASAGGSPGAPTSVPRLAVARAVEPAVETLSGKARIGWATARPDWPTPAPLALPRGEAPAPMTDAPPWAITTDPATGAFISDSLVPGGGLIKAPPGWWTTGELRDPVPGQVWFVSGFLVLMALAIVSIGISRGRFTYDFYVILTVFLGAALLMPLGLKRDFVDLRRRRSRSCLVIDSGNASKGQIAAVIDVAVRNVCPDVKCVVPYLAAEGWWSQPRDRLELAFLTKDAPMGPYLRLESTRSVPVVGAVKGAIVGALYEGVDLQQPEERERLLAFGAGAAATPDLPRPLALRLSHYASLAFLEFAAVFLAFLTLVAFRTSVIDPLFGVRPAAPVNTYFALLLVALLAVLFQFLIVRAWLQPGGPKREWPEGWAAEPARPQGPRS
jgi:hypothetical protein